MSLEDVERRKMWLDYARELGQEADFKALIEAERRDAVEMYKATQEQQRSAELRGLICGFRDLSNPAMPECTSPPHPITEPHTWPHRPH